MYSLFYLLISVDLSTDKFYSGEHVYHLMNRRRLAVRGAERWEKII